jgi:hypothetical protein
MKNNKRFRLLGLRTGKHNKPVSEKEVTKDFIKVLNEETYYPLYSCYSYDKKLNTLIYNSELDIDIFNDDDKNKVNVQISAIVGKNGSGKSTLLELIYLANYNIGCRCGLLEEWITTGDSDYDKKCKEIPKGDYQKCKALSLTFELYFESGGKVGKLTFNKESIKYFQEESRELGEILFKILPDNGNELSEKHEELTTLFYSIAINYSIYGLNSESLGKWVIPLFHKNDGYKTPLVINPMRDKGNFDINEEMEFATYRLLSNLLYQQKAISTDGNQEKIYVTDKQYVEKIRFKFNPNKIKVQDIKDSGVFISGGEESLNILLDLYAEFYNETEQINVRLSQLPFKEAIQNYIVQKANKILRTYEEYKSKYLIQDKIDTRFNWDKKDDFAKSLNEDNSHITFKLKQALNYLRNCLYLLDQKEGNEESEKLKWDFNKKEEWFKFSLKELLNTMHSDETIDIIRNIPPSIFTIEIELSENSSVNFKQKALFTDLSSGEQQLIHSVNSVLYHLNNLNSAHYSNDGRLAYTAVNIIFDEIELYFHPEYQRKFVSYLIDSINRLPFSEEKGVKAINVLFSTHSPFILSDIPSQNLLMLKIDELKGKSVQETKNNQTFGANIHDLLANSFFLEKGYIGEKAVEIINSVITKLNTWSDDESIEVSYEEQRRVRSIIGLIGNELIKGKLIEMYDERFNDYEFREIMAKEYEKRAKELRSK